MNGRRQNRRGQPLAVLGAVLIGWTVMRALLWQSPFALADALARDVIPRMFAAGEQAPVKSVAAKTAAAAVAVAADTPQAPVFGSPAPAYASALQPLPVRDVVQIDPPAPFAPRSASYASGSQLLWMAAMSALPVAPEVAAVYQSWATPRFPFRPQAGRSGWSADGWILYRSGSRSGFAATSGPASYGASQAGAALRYRINSGGGFRPEAYLRATTALSQSEREIAAGLSARPITGLPVRVGAELRQSTLQSATELRPAIIANTELAPVDLPAGLRGEAYAQAGYIGGDNATAFVDGQIAVSRQVARFDLGALRAGAGSWGGAQKGSSRLDVGPTAAVDLELGEARVRLSVDYRIKIAGDAEPGSGVALTLASGF